MPPEPVPSLTDACFTFIVIHVTNSDPLQSLSILHRDSVQQMRQISSRSELIFKASRAPPSSILEHVVHLWEFQNGGIFLRFRAKTI